MKIDTFHDEKEARSANTVSIDAAVLAGIASNAEDFEVGSTASPLTALCHLLRRNLVREAHEANEEERHMPVLKALKLYPKAMACRSFSRQRLSWRGDGSLR